MNRSLIVHIGTGKTGSTAIQRSLRASSESLRANRIYYWGLNLERCSSDLLLYDWQSESGTCVLQRLRDAEASEQVKKVLDTALLLLPNNHTAVWSNESIYERPAVYIPAIQRSCQEAGVNATIVCYVREYSSYINSAYRQWGIKHKTYAGRVMGFNDWVHSRTNFLRYGKFLSAWDQAFADNLHLVNFDTISDAVKSFSEFLPESASLEIQNKRFNASPANELLYLYAILNNQSDPPVLPAAVQALLRRYNLNSSEHQIIDLASIFPTKADIESVIELFREDMEQVNQMLRSRGQAELQLSAQGMESAPPATTNILSSLVSILFKMITIQDERINQLEERLQSDSKVSSYE